MRSQRRGLSIGPLIMISFLSLTLVLMYSANVLTKKHQFLHVEFSQKAADLAQSGLAHAIGKFREDRKFGKAGEVLSGLMPYPEDPKAGYVVKFSPDESINNWGSDAAVYFDSSKSKVACPPGGLYLTAVGTYRGHSERVSAMLSAPPFSSAIASRGSIQSTQGMILGSVPADYDPTKALDIDALQPSELQADGDLTIRGKSTIVGTAKASKNADYDKDAVKVVRGSIEGFSKVDEIPDLDVASLSFTGKDGVQTLPKDSFTEQEKLSGLIEWTGQKLTFEQGLKLNGGVLRVHGNIEIKGGVTGSGAILCDGNVTVVGASSMSADNQAAIVANGGIAVVGTGSENSFYQGLLYAKGADGVAVVNSTVLGTVISAGKQAPTKIERSTVAFTKSSTHIDLDLGWTGYDPEKGIVTKRTTSNGPVDTVLKLAPIVGPDGNVILEPKPKDFLAAGIHSLTADVFTFEDGIGGKYYSGKITDAELLKTLRGQGFVLDPGGKIQAGYDDNGQRIRDDIEPALAPPKTGETQRSTSFKLDLNQFLKTSDRLRIVWRS